MKIRLAGEPPLSKQELEDNKVESYILAKVDAEKGWVNVDMMALRIRVEKLEESVLEILKFIGYVP